MTNCGPLRAAALGGGITLLLTLMVTSSQYLLFTYPGEHFAMMRDFHRISIEGDEEKVTDDRLKKTFNEISTRAAQREVLMRKIDKTGGAATEEDRGDALDAYLETLLDKGKIEGILDGNPRAGSPAPAFLQSLDLESKQWNFYLDSKPTVSAETKWRRRFEVMESLNSLIGSYQNWAEDLSAKNDHRQLQIEELKDHMHVSEFKSAAALIFLVITLIVLWIYGNRLAVYLGDGHPN